MSMIITASEIARFLKSPDPEVMCITGKWGVGKTFAWKAYLNKARDAKEIALKQYSYVSLFGQNSLDDVRNSIAENAAPIAELEKGINLDLLKRKFGDISKLARQLPQVQSYGTFGARIMFAVLKEHIICIDDFERAGKGLAKEDVLGLISQMKEQKDCKIVLLLNDEQLKGDDKDKFDSQIEKVADIVLKFDPSPAEAAEIGVDRRTVFHEKLAHNCTGLGITNIRVIKRIERFAKRLQGILSEFDERILWQAIHSVALFGFSKYQPSIAPSLDFIRKYNELVGISGREQLDPYKDWRVLLNEYEFRNVDELDRIILEGVDHGFFDEAALKEAARAQQEALARGDQDNSMQEAWRHYHDSFDDNQDTVLDGIYAAFKANIATISPLNVNGTVQLFKDLGRFDQGKDIIKLYIEGRNEPREFWDLDNYPFSSDIKDVDFIAAFNAKFASMVVSPNDPEKLLIDSNHRYSWSREDVEILAQVTADQFYGIFKRLRGQDLRRAVHEALRFQNRGPAGSPEATISQQADAALDRIAMESEINRRRVSQLRGR